MERYAHFALHVKTKNYLKQDKLLVSAKVQKHHLHSNSFTSGNYSNLTKYYSEKESLRKSG